MSKVIEQRKVLVEQTLAAATRLVADLCKGIICESVQQRGMCRVALAGGTTPHHLYQRLAETTVAAGEVPWGNVEIFFGDERNVPHDHVESNYRMARLALLDHVPVPPQQVHPMPADAADLDAAAADYERVIRRLLPQGADGLPHLDLILLGMGAEGHVASLFPHTPAVREDGKLVMAYFVPVLDRWRMTFTYRLINAAHNVILLVTGEDKAAAVARVLAGQRDIDVLPASGIQPTDGKLFLVLDRAAASRTNVR